MEIVAFASLKHQLELWFPETSLFWFLWPEQNGGETHTPQKKPHLGWEEKRTAVLQGGPLFLGGVIPEGQVPTRALSPWCCVTRECSRRSVGELQLFVSSDCSLWESAVTQPILTAARPGCRIWSFLAGLSELLGCSQVCCATALEAPGCKRFRNGGRHRLLRCSWELWFAFPACFVQPWAPVQQRCWLTAHLTGGPRPQTKSSRWLRVTIKLLEW